MPDISKSAAAPPRALSLFIKAQLPYGDCGLKQSCAIHAEELHLAITKHGFWGIYVAFMGIIVVYHEAEQIYIAWLGKTLKTHFK